MCNLHGVVIDYVCKVVRRKAVPLNENEVIFALGAAVSAVDQVAHLGVTGTPDSHTMRLSGGSTTVRFALRDMTALSTVVCRGLAARTIGILHIVQLQRVQLLGRAEASVCLPSIEKLFGVEVVEIKPLRLGS
jgi:hypothetical protein